MKHCQHEREQWERRHDHGGHTDAHFEEGEVHQSIGQAEAEQSVDRAPEQRLATRQRQGQRPRQQPEKHRRRGEPDCGAVQGSQLGVGERDSDEVAPTDQYGCAECR